MADLATAYLQIIPSFRGVKENIKKEIGGETASEAGSSFGSDLVAGIKKVVVAAGIGSILKETLDQGAALEQSIGGIETLYKTSADQMKSYADEAYKTSGLSANAYMETATGFAASLISSLDGDTAKAAEVANRAIIDMSDNANKMGTDIGSIQTAYQGFAKQNYVLLDNLKLGYGGTKEEMQRLISDASKMTEQQKELGVVVDASDMSFANIANAISVVQAKLEISGATAKEAATTFSGSFAAMKAAAENLLGNLAIGNIDGVIESVSALIETAITFIKDNAVPMLINIATSLPQLIATAINTLIPENAMQTVTELVNNLASFITNNLPTLVQKGTEMLSNIVNGFLGNLPELITGAGEMILTLLNAIGTALPQIMDSGKDMLLNIVTGIVNNLPQIVDSATQIIHRFADTVRANFPTIMQKGIEILGELGKGIIQAIPTIVAQIPKVIAAILDAFLAIKGNMLTVGLNLVEGLWNGIADKAGWLKSKITGWVGDIKSFLMNLFEIHSPSTWAKDVIGQNIALGVGEGFSESIGAVTDEMFTSIPSAADLSGALSYNASLNYDSKPITTGDTTIKTYVTLDGKIIAESVDKRLGSAAGLQRRFA